jgi:phage/plasmid-like protein (TIGR03299 family)
MAHNIAEINGKAAMAYQNETPWHSLGTRLASMDVEAALKAASLDWNVRLEPMFVEGISPAIEQNYRRVPNRKAVVRDVDEEILGTVGDNYIPIQNSEAFGILNSACREFGVTIETAGALGKGERCWMLANLQGQMEVTDGDLIEPYFLVITGHDGATPTTARPTPIRVVCQNTLEIALAAGNKKVVMRLTHAKDNKKELELAEAMVRHLYEHLTEQLHGFRTLVNTKVTDELAGVYFDRVLRIDTGAVLKGVLARRRGLLDILFHEGKGAELAPGTLWTAYNAVTEYVDHVRPAETKSAKRRDKANESALFGANLVIKARALELATEMV